MWKSPTIATPQIVQVAFGAWGQDMPGDGEAYCGPTSMVMGLYYLYANGFTQFAPGPFVSQDDPQTINLELVIAGLCHASSTGGTYEEQVQHGIGHYLSACGVAPSQYSLASSPNPSLEWLYGQLFPNSEENPDTIVLANFGVGWYSGTPPALTNDGGHFLTPLFANLDGGTLTLNNAYPASFADVPNEPSAGEQTVGIVAVPPDWVLPGLSPQSLSYSQVISQTKGSGTSYAVLWLGQAWTISASASPGAADYAVSVWEIERTVNLNTNGGELTVIAPISGAGSLHKWGLGTVLLTASNALSGPVAVNRGVLASTVTGGTPFGTGSISLEGGGTLALAPGDTASLTIAGGSGSTLTVGRGGRLVFANGNNVSVTVGGDALSTAAIDRMPRGTLTVTVGGDSAVLGSTQNLTIGGNGSPPIANGIVSPWVLGQTDDGTGFFLTYAENGFAPAQPVLSSSEGINSAPSDVPYRIVEAQIIDSGSTVRLAALEIDGASVSGDIGTTLEIGDQSTGSIAGLILNGGSLACGTLSLGASEGAIFTSTSGVATISSAISGTAGLTMVGPGTLTLEGSAGGLSGPVSVNGGTLVIAGSGGTGSGSIYVNSAATLEVSGSVSGAVYVAESGTLLLSGGTVGGELSTAPIGNANPAPGSVLQGTGTISGVAVVNGAINSGPAAGLLTFTNNTTVSDTASFTWTLQDLVDNTNSEPGEGWNGLVFGSTASTVGDNENFVPLYLDFTQVGSDPDGENPFWSTGRRWTFLTFAAKGGHCFWQWENFAYQSGNFSLEWDDWTVCLVWTPSSHKQSVDERRRYVAAARHARLPGRPAA